MVLSTSENRWTPGVGAMGADEFDSKMKQVKCLLNKLTPEKFEKLMHQLYGIGINNEKTLQGVIALIYDKAITERHFCEMYAKACRVLNENLLAVEMEDTEEGAAAKKVSFKRILLTRCQEEFEKQGTKEEEEVSAQEKDENMKRSMGNVKFVGELFKIELLTEKIMHQCIRKLLGDIKNPAHEDVESLCNLMETIGKKLDQEKAASYMNQYFDRMQRMAAEEVGLPTRLRFRLKDILELRRNNWQLRKLQEQAGPKTLEEIHRDFAVKDAKGGRGKVDPRRVPSGNLGPPSLAHLRGPQASSQAPPQAQAGPGGMGGFGGGPGRTAAGKGGDVGAFERPRPGPAAPDKSSKPVASGTILGDRRRSVDKSVPAAAPVKLTPEVFNLKTEGLLAEYLACGDADEACECIKELQTNFEKAVEKIYTDVLEKKEKDRTMAVQLIHTAVVKGVVSAGQAVEALSALMGMMEEMEMDIPMMGAYVATFISDLAAADLIQLAQLQGAIQSIAEFGKAAKLAAKVLGKLKELEGVEKAREHWLKSGIDLKLCLNVEERDEQHLLEFVREQNLGWLYPLHASNEYLSKAFTEEQDPQTVLEWLQGNIEEQLLHSKQGASAVMRLMLHHFGSEEAGTNLKKYGKILEKLYGSDTVEAKKCQLTLLFEVQLYCVESNFPEGMLRRLFHSLYDFDIVLEDTFNMWKEDTDETVDGKRTAVLHANSFLQWLAEAEEDDEDGEEEEDD